MQFKFTVRGDRITRENENSFVEGNQNSYTAVFDFGNDANWDNVARFCVIETDSGDVYRIPIFENGCTLPVLEKGKFEIGVMGVMTYDGDVIEGEEGIVISTNMYPCETIRGAASKEANAELNNAAQVWMKYISDMEEKRQAAAESAEEAKASAEAAAESEKNTLKAQENSENSAKNAVLSENSARQYAETSLLSKNESVRAEKSALQALERVIELAEATEKAKDESVLAKEGLETAETNAKKDAANAKASADKAATSEENAKKSEEVAERSKTEAAYSATEAQSHADKAYNSSADAAESEEIASQALADLLAMINSGDIVLAVNGKLPLSAIPATATQEIYVVESEDELTSLVAQRGDLAELVEEIDGERTITKTWQCLGDASVRANWVVWGTSYAVQSGNATTADNAVNANMINNHRLVEMTEEDFASAVKDNDTYYLVY